MEAEAVGGALRCSVVLQNAETVRLVGVGVGSFSVSGLVTKLIILAVLELRRAGYFMSCGASGAYLQG